MNGIVYHKDFNKYDLGVKHPLVGDKPKRIMNFLKEKGILDKIKIFEPIIATQNDLKKVHSQKYIDRVKELSKTGGMLSTDTPAPIGIYKIARLVTGGTIIAGDKLFDNYKSMINPIAGFHHASKSFSSGFCFFNDIAVVIEFLRDKYKLKRFQIIDLDVHHGNGTQEIYYANPSVLKISFHQDGRTLYPGTGAIEKIGRGKGEGYNINLPLPPGTGENSYIYAFNEIIPSLTKQFKPDILIYQCGVDTHHSDPLADLNLVHQTYYHLASKVSKLSKSSCNKLLVLFGGGYNSNESLISYYNIMCGLLNKRNYIKEKKIQDNFIDKIKELVNELKSNIKPYWRI